MSTLALIYLPKLHTHYLSPMPLSSYFLLPTKFLMCSGSRWLGPILSHCLITASFTQTLTQWTSSATSIQLPNSNGICVSYIHYQNEHLRRANFHLILVHTYWRFRPMYGQLTVVAQCAHGRSTWQRKPLTSWQQEREREEKTRQRSQSSLQGQIFKSSNFHSDYLRGSTTSLQQHRLRTKPSTGEPLVDIPNPKISSTPKCPWMHLQHYFCSSYLRRCFHFLRLVFFFFFAGGALSVSESSYPRRK